MNHVPDYVYYVEVDGEIDAMKPFGTRQDAEDWAKDNCITEYSIVEWDVQ